MRPYTNSVRSRVSTLVEYYASIGSGFRVSVFGLSIGTVSLITGNKRSTVFYPRAPMYFFVGAFYFPSQSLTPKSLHPIPGTLNSEPYPKFPD